MERIRVIKEREHEDYIELNRTTKVRVITPFEDPFTIPILENQDNTWWNPPSEEVTTDPSEDKYYCYYCKDMMINTKEFVEHRKFHETSRKQAKIDYLARKKKIEAKIRKVMSVGESKSIHL